MRKSCRRPNRSNRACAWVDRGVHLRVDGGEGWKTSCAGVRAFRCRFCADITAAYVVWEAGKGVHSLQVMRWTWVLVGRMPRTQHSTADEGSIWIKH